MKNLSSGPTLSPLHFSHTTHIHKINGLVQLQAQIIIIQLYSSCNVVSFTSSDSEERHEGDGSICLVKGKSLSSLLRSHRASCLRASGDSQRPLGENIHGSLWIRGLGLRDRASRSPEFLLLRGEPTPGDIYRWVRARLGPSSTLCARGSVRTRPPSSCRRRSCDAYIRLARSGTDEAWNGSPQLNISTELLGSSLVCVDLGSTAPSGWYATVGGRSIKLFFCHATFAASRSPATSLTPSTANSRAAAPSVPLR